MSGYRLCRHLRWKSFHGRPWRDDAELEAILARNEVPCSCLRSLEVWGPDEDPVTPEGCQPGRACFEPSPHQRRSPGEV